MKKFSEGLVNKVVILRALKIVPGQTIIDAGCGSGYMAKAFSERLNRIGKVYAIDRDRSAIETLEKEISDTCIEALTADITRKTQVEASSADLIYFSTVFYLLSKKQISCFLKEVKRLLKPEGRLAIVEIQKHDTPFGPPLAVRYSPEELAQAVDLKPEMLIEAGEHFYMQIFKNR
ncbi:MAG: class I SAM-dependent methyltransferase [Desulfobacterales bacterium]|nr:class I SAM-dependent methyltransferase [Desulfobacterales bacterium]